MVPRMTDYNQDIARTDIAGVVPEDVASEIIQSVTRSSVALSVFPSIRMSQKTRRLPVLSALPTAYWIDGDSDPSSDTGLKKTTQMAWDKKYITAEELAVIVPVPEAVLDDSTFDIFGEVRPRLSEAMALKIDGAVFSGEDAPASWGNNGFIGLAPGADAAGNDGYLGTSTQGHGGLAEDLNLLYGKVEEDGFDVNFVAAARTFRAALATPWARSSRTSRTMAARSWGPRSPGSFRARSARTPPSWATSRRASSASGRTSSTSC